MSKLPDYLAPELDHPAGIHSRKRIGIVRTSAHDLAAPALSYLLLALNNAQRAFQFELIRQQHPSRLIKLLESKAPVDREIARSYTNEFVARLRDDISDKNASFKTFESPPDCYVVISCARFSNNFYSLREGACAVLALGNWRRSMAPPSLVEFALNLVLRQAVAFVAPSLRGSVHFSTKGCLFDFNPYLSDVRLMVLTGYVCQECRERLIHDGHTELLPDLLHVLSHEWLGKSTDQRTPSGIAAKLGVDLFRTKGLTKTSWERLKDSLVDQGLKEFLRIIGTIIIAGLLLWLGLKQS